MVIGFIRPSCPPCIGGETISKDTSILEETQGSSTCNNIEEALQIPKEGFERLVKRKSTIEIPYATVYDIKSVFT